MTPTSESMPQVTSTPTQHALLVVWGHFAPTLDLYARLTLVPLVQKTVHYTPAAKLLTLFLGLLCGNEYLTDLTTHPPPSITTRKWSPPGACPPSPRPAASAAP